MKIELKNIQYSSALSEETNAFSANVYIDGVKAAIATNHGYGGNTNIDYLHPQGRELMQKAEDWCKTLPPDVGEFNGQTYSYQWTLESYVDKIIDDFVNAKSLKQFRNKVAKAAEKGIVYGVPDKSFSGIDLKQPIDFLLKQPGSKQILKNMLVKNIIPKMQPGDIILNTNLPEKLLKEAGLKPDQYKVPNIKNSVVKEKSKKKGKRI